MWDFNPNEAIKSPKKKTVSCISDFEILKLHKVQCKTRPNSLIDTIASNNGYGWKKPKPNANLTPIP